MSHRRCSTLRSCTNSLRNPGRRSDRRRRYGRTLQIWITYNPGTLVETQNPYMNIIPKGEITPTDPQRKKQGVRLNQSRSPDRSRQPERLRPLHLGTSKGLEGLNVTPLNNNRNRRSSTFHPWGLNPNNNFGGDQPVNPIPVGPPTGREYPEPPD
ncbi:hypothetical protein EAF04_004944 [Stromatinia cepivora]|nr:hypothetical protein EAF04_004944 [Stromatinia cepivora]